jgi:hypothetical protein
MKKKSQISIYIIIGILILIVFSIYIALKNKNEFKPTLIIPDNVRPIKNYLDRCIYDLSKEGIIIQGKQGGFIEIPNQILFQHGSYISLGQGGVIKIPLWYYNGENRMPTLNYMRAELEKYISEGLDSCIDNLNLFENFIVYNGSAKVDVVYGEKDVFVTVKLPLIIRNLMETQETRINDFYAVIPVRMRNVYSLAENIYIAEYSKLFLENLTIELMASDFRFPFTGMDVECGRKQWVVKDLKELFENILYYNYARLRIKDTQHVPFLYPESKYKEIVEKAIEIRKILEDASYSGMNDPFDDAVRKVNLGHVPEDIYEYTHLYFDVGSTTPDIVAKILYEPRYGMDFRPKPSQGGIMSSKDVQGAYKYLSFFCLNFYHFTYDINYPVEVRIVDYESLPDEGGYTFSYGLPVTIRNNMATKEKYRTSIFDSKEASYNFCDEIFDEPTEITVTGVYQDQTDINLADVNLTYQCVKYYCNLGNTSTVVDGDYKFYDKIPSSCVNPLIIAEKEGYLSNKAQLTESSLNIHLQKLQKMNISFRKKMYQNGVLQQGSRLLSTNNQNPADNEIVVLMMSFLDHEHSQYISYPIGEQNPFKNIDLLVEGGDYSISALLIKGNDTIGGYINENITITYPEISGKKEMIITLIDFNPLPKKDEDITEMMMYLFNGTYLTEVPIEFN